MMMMMIYLSDPMRCDTTSILFYAAEKKRQTQQQKEMKMYVIIIRLIAYYCTAFTLATAAPMAAVPIWLLSPSYRRSALLPWTAAEGSAT